MAYPLSVDVTMPHPYRRLLYLQATPELIGDEHRAVTAARASDPHREIGLPFPNVERHQVPEEGAEPAGEVERLGEGSHVADHPAVLAGQGAQARDEVRVGEKADVEQQVGLERHAVLVPEADQVDV